jgi:hypothetical protein
MAKITVLEAKTYQGKPSGFKVTLDNGTTGNLQEKESDKGLRVGDEVVVTLIPYTSKAGVQSNLLGLKLVTSGQVSGQVAPTPAPQPQKKELKEGEILMPSTRGIEHAKTLQEMRFESRVHCLKLAVKCYLGRGIEYPKVAEYFNEWVVLMDTAIDELKSK